MHFRKIEPDPIWEEPPSYDENYNVFLGRYRCLDCYGEPYDDVDGHEPPADMPGAVPWQDRDGTWYWRLEKVG